MTRDDGVLKRRATHLDLSQIFSVRGVKYLHIGTQDVHGTQPLSIKPGNRMV